MIKHFKSREITSANEHPSSTPYLDAQIKQRLNVIDSEEVHLRD